MLIDDINKANIQAMRDKDANARKILGILKNKILVAEVAKRTTNTAVTEVEIISILQKTVKELEDEINMFKNAGKLEEVESLIHQKAVVEKFLPQMMSPDEIRKIILAQEDKSMPNIMKLFKAEYAGKVNMKDVQEVLKTI